jgi:lipoprotein-anchoring transpeptidase ErfK/SrfK
VRLALGCVLALALAPAAGAATPVVSATTSSVTGPAPLEVNKGRQVLLVVREGRVTTVVHASTGATGNTPIGRWHVYRKAAGWDWVLWYPMYFQGGFAIHGYPSVPTFPASHGCVRVPMWIAPDLYSTDPFGQTVYAY